MQFPSRENFEKWFIKPNKTPYPLSGWKLHISGESEEDSIIIRNALIEVIEKYNLGWKLARDEFFKLANEKGRNQYKSSTIYLPIKVINSGKQFQVVKDISSNLKENKYGKDIPIKGSNKIANSIYYRYDLDIPLTKEGFSREEYFKRYKPSGGNFNIEGNKDILGDYKKTQM